MVLVLRGLVGLALFKAGRRLTAQAMALRARIVLACAEGAQNQDVAVRLGVSKQTVSKWRRRFAEPRLEGLRDEPRPGAPRTVDDARIEAVITRTLESAPLDATHWSSRGMARASGLFGVHGAALLACSRTGWIRSSFRPIRTLWPRSVTWWAFTWPRPSALVLCVDEKGQIQALDRSQPVLPMRPGQPERRSHDHRRHGTTSLFAALDAATGRVIGTCYPRHRAAEFRRFLDEVEANVPCGLDVHLIMDNHATHKTKLVRDWLAKRPRWHVHHTPTSSSWLNQVERFFAALTDKQIRRGIHRSVADLRAAIEGFIQRHNSAPKPFRWTKPADDILASVERFCLPSTPAQA